MDLTISEIIVDDLAITPTLMVGVCLHFSNKTQIPLSISGRLIIGNGKVISLLSENSISHDSYFDLYLLTKAEKEQLLKEKATENMHYFRLSAPLSQKAIEYIESCR